MEVAARGAVPAAAAKEAGVGSGAEAKSAKSGGC